MEREKETYAVDMSNVCLIKRHSADGRPLLFHTALLASMDFLLL